jgi:uncharacterized membrane protein (UPF0127 family)
MNANASACRFLLALLATTSLAAASWADGARELDQVFPRSTLRIATPDARLHTFKVWVAADDARRARGLMHVRELADDEGMLFVYQQEQMVGMWMKNTYIPLDMLFVAADGRVIRVAPNTTPHSLETVSSGRAALAVIELKGGTAAKLGIRAGARVAHPAFEQ